MVYALLIDVHDFIAQKQGGCRLLAVDLDA